jgi:hypothetical protein
VTLIIVLYTMLLGQLMTTQYDQIFADAEDKYGLPRGYLKRTAEIESGLNAHAKNPYSSAGGLFQFIDSTAEAYGVDRYDPVSATEGAARLAADNAAYLRKVLGREPTAAELYLAHQQGMGGAAKLLTRPHQRAVDLVGARQVKLNAGSDSMTGIEFASKWLNKFDRGGLSIAKAPTARPKQDVMLSRVDTVTDKKTITIKVKTRIV